MPNYEYTTQLSNPDVQWLWTESVTISADLIAISLSPGSITFTYAEPLTDSKKLSLDSAVTICPESSISGRVLTKWAFRSRFTFQERMLLDNSTDPAVVVLRNDLSSAEHVDLDDPAVSQGFDLLIYNNIISPSRKSEILA